MIDSEKSQLHRQCIDLLEQKIATLDILRYLGQVQPELQKDRVGFGSLVTTNEGNYYFSVGMGKVQVQDRLYMALSMASPIGKALADRKAGDEVTFMGRKIRIEKVA